MNICKVFHGLIRNTKSALLLIFVSFLIQGCIEQRSLDTENSGVLPGGYYVSLDNKNVVLDQGARADGILVKFASDTSSRTRTRSIQSAGLRENGRFRLVPGLTLADVLPGFTLNQTLNALARDPNVAFAEPNYIVTTDALPNDPRFNQQYGLNNTGQSGGVVDADIDAPEAWDIQTGNDVIVAVIDTGVDYNHPDLVNNMWQNPGEIPGNRIDDDGNGFVDDVRGWDFATNTNDPMDPNRHGTHVAGVIAAQGNNGTGVTGINWSARIMPLKFMDNQGVGTTAAAIRAIEYAVANGAKVSNNSWGGGNFSQALFDAIQAANRAGHMFIAASGNDGVSNDRTPHYPSSFDLPNIISVGASDESDLITTFSNFGATSVDLLAPGASIFSTVINNGYASLSGTSMATPFVSGVASLLFAHNRDLTVSGVRNAILNNVDRLPALNRVVASGGRLNVFNAINSIQQGTPAPTPNPGTPVQPPQNPPVPQPDVVTISPNNAEVPIGGSFNFSASGGQGPYAWSVGNSTIGTIDSVSGVFQALTIGSTNVIATDSVGLASAPVNISVTNIVITPANVNTLQLTEVRTFTVNGGQGPFTWTASNPSIANIVVEGTQQESVTVTPNAQGTFN
ncbi:MAG: S8 family serine peptidase, partial [Gammaproteobacteria bacterium]|nr:S8 family serine peptidase [Gammaproteobacteria bacterium]